jgi:inner membrane protein
MTGRTHDLAAFTTLIGYIAYGTVPKMTFATAFVSFSSAMIGGLLPDIDNATSDFWQKIPAGTFIGRVIHPLIGHHRMISHSIIGIFIAGFLIKQILSAISHVLIVDMNIVWWTLMMSYISHLIMDSFTIEGVPWFFPIPIRIGFPPFKFLRIKTGGLVEKIVIFPGLFILNGYLIYSRYPEFMLFIRSIFK